MSLRTHFEPVLRPTQKLRTPSVSRAPCERTEPRSHRGRSCAIARHAHDHIGRFRFFYAHAFHARSGHARRSRRCTTWQARALHGAYSYTLLSARLLCCRSHVGPPTASTRTSISRSLHPLRPAALQASLAFAASHGCLVTITPSCPHARRDCTLRTMAGASRLHTHLGCTVRTTAAASSIESLPSSFARVT